jgi:hypothetical protein
MTEGQASPPPEDARDAVRRAQGKAPVTCAVGPCPSPRLPGSSYCAGHGPEQAEKTRGREGWYIAGAFIALLALFAGCGALMSSEDSDETGAQPGQARNACHDFVSDQLKSPGSADFEGVLDAKITGSGSTYTVRGWVDSDNSFGASVRTSYVCVVSGANSSWRLQSLATDP